MDDLSEGDEAGQVGAGRLDLEEQRQGRSYGEQAVPNCSTKFTCGKEDISLPAEGCRTGDGSP